MRTLLAALAASSLLVAGACSSDDDPASAPAAEATAPDAGGSTPPYFEGLVSGVFSVVAPPSALPAVCSTASACALSAFSCASLEVAAACDSRLSALASAA